MAYTAVNCLYESRSELPLASHNEAAITHKQNKTMESTLLQTPQVEYHTKSTPWAAVYMCVCAHVWERGHKNVCGTNRKESMEGQR